MSFYEFLKFTAFELEGFEIYKDALRTFEILTGMPLARRGRRAVRLPAKFRRGKKWGWEEEWLASTRRSRHTFWRSWEEEEMTGRSFPTVAEAAVEGRSSARRFPARRRAKLGLNSCRKMWGNYWSS
jgi:hypothetical protein